MNTRHDWLLIPAILLAMAAGGTETLWAIGVWALLSFDLFFVWFWMNRGRG